MKRYIRSLIKESVDNLPVGIGFFGEQGLPVLCNRRMHQLACLLLGSDVQCLSELQSALNRPPKGIARIDSAADALRFPDGCDLPLVRCHDHTGCQWVLRILHRFPDRFRRMSDFRELLALCQGHRIFIQTRNFPDPDAIGSAFGLKNLLAAFGVESTICYAGRIDKLSSARMLDTCGIEMVAYEELKGYMAETDEILCVDSQKNSGNLTDFIGDEIACIDHHSIFHEEVYRFSDIRIAGACASLVAQYYSILHLEPDPDTATALLYGIKMDTLQFTRGVTPLDIEMFSFLFPLCDPEKLSHLECNHMEFTDLKAYGEAIENIEIYGRTAFSFVSFSCPDALIAVLADFLLSLEEVDVAVVSSRREDGLKLSVRSEPREAHAGQLIRLVLAGVGDGGGHAGMAGGLVRTENLSRLGNYPEQEICDRFLSIMADPSAKLSC